MAAYMALPLVIKLAMFLVFLPVGIHKTMTLIHTQGQRANGWMGMINLPLAVVADSLAVATAWLAARDQLDKRIRRKRLRRDYDRQALPPASNESEEGEKVDPSTGGRASS